MTTEDGSMQQDITNPARKATTIHYALKKKINQTIKLKIYNTIPLPSMLYASELYEASENDRKNIAEKTKFLMTENKMKKHNKR